MELKRYQERALQRFTDWFRCLKEAHGSVDVAWGNLSWDSERPTLFSRFDSASRPIPHVCMRIPTGGGKTLLAVESLVRMHQRTGLVLWMVPNTAIYEQTKRAMWTKQHPYRMVLVAIVRVSRTGKKQRDGDRLHAEDVREYLTNSLGIPSQEVKVQSSETKELRGEGLMSPSSQGSNSTF